MRSVPGFVLLSLTLAAGCRSQGANDDRVKVYPVEGTLNVLGRPAGNAHVAFHHTDKARIGGLCPVGITRPDGTFRVTTYRSGDGAPEGEYVVTVVWPNEATMALEECCADPITHDRFCGLYLDPAKSPLRATVRPGPNGITLHTTVGGRGWNLPRLKDAGKSDDRSPSGARDRPGDR